ncbi:ABC transporter permease [Nostocoides sp. HKS02]|uniref:ABC transporter permease n=1 Tax=Nostocoides sp. HKS02 TaxID=1813880 RepID=UPI0012B4C92B|nr:ABC transporter permease subunit [Tetrasphaera sp. HKS02]QGN56623.1 ABC transporter permease subunit [Tetrasphaera sp. HKS02]
MSGGRGQRAAFRRRQDVLRWVVVTVVLLFFFTPLVASLDFTTRDASGNRSLQTWTTLLNFPAISQRYPDLQAGFLASVGLAVLTVGIMLVLLVPTMTWVRLRVPGATRTVEFLCLLPLTVPAIVLVVGLTPVYAWVTYFLGGATIWLAFAYVVLVLPYAYRAIDAGLRAIDVRTLSEAARSLGASWPTVMARVILPNLRTAVLSASFLAVALTLGEFTIANLFSRTNLQVAMFLLGKSDAQISVAVGLASLVFAFLVLFAMSFVGGQRGAVAPLARLRRNRKETR